MNNLIVNSNKELSYKGSTLLYRGEVDFEQLRVIIPQKIGKRKMADWLTDVTLVVLTPSQSYSVALTFEPSDIHKGYISQVIDVPEEWCAYTGILKMYIQFDNSSELGVTNVVDIEVKANVDEETPIPVDEFVRESEFLEGLSEKLDIFDGLTYAGHIGTNDTLYLSDAMKARLGIEDESIHIDDYTNKNFDNTVMRISIPMHVRNHDVGSSDFLLVNLGGSNSIIIPISGHYCEAFVPYINVYSSDPPSTSEHGIFPGTTCKTLTGFFKCLTSAYDQEEGHYNLTWQKIGNVDTDDLLSKADDSAVMHKAETLAQGENFTIEKANQTGLIRFYVPNYMSYGNGIQVIQNKNNIDNSQWAALRDYCLQINFPTSLRSAGDIYQLSLSYDCFVFERVSSTQAVIKFPNASGVFAIVGHNSIDTQGDGIILDDADGDGQVVISPRGGSGHQGSVEVLDDTCRAYIHPESLSICALNYNTDDSISIQRLTGGNSKVVVRGLGSTPGEHRYSTAYSSRGIEMTDVDNSTVWAYGFPKKSGTIAFMESTVPRVVQNTLPPTEAVSASYDEGTIWYYKDSGVISRMFVCIATSHEPGNKIQHTWAEISMTPYSGT